MDTVHPSRRGGTKHKRRIFMTTKISQWQRIALLAAGVATGMASMAGGQTLYQTHTDGSIWQYTGKPCKGTVCSGWIELDNNPHLKSIAANSGELYELHKDGSIWWYTGPACSGGYCPGWVEVDNNPLAVEIGVSNDILYEVHSDNSLWEYDGTVCSGGYCPGWYEMSGPYTASPTYVPSFGANGSLMAWLDPTGIIWLFGDAFGSWIPIDGQVWSFTAGQNALYVFTDNGLFQYTGTPSSLLQIDDDATTKSIAAGSVLYQQRKDHSTWQYTGTSCGGGVCPGWLEIDDHANAGPPVAGPNTVYQMRRAAREVSIWQYNGTPCSGKVCSGWTKLDDNAATKSIVAGPMTF
jgi:hypothetical protein